MNAGWCVYRVTETETVRQRQRPYIHYTCMRTYHLVGKYFVPYNLVGTKYASGYPLALFTHSHAHAN